MRDEILFNSKFEPLFNVPENVRYFVITGGRFSSKSYSVSTAICNLVNTERRKALYTRYTLTSAKDSIIPEFVEKIELLGLSDWYKPKQDRIVGPSNREVVFKGLKTSSGSQTAKLKSLKGFSVFVLDEAEEENDEKSFDKINLSIRENNVSNIVVLILNPTSKEHWIYKRFFEDKGVEPGSNFVKENVCYIHTTYLDAIDFIPKDYLFELELLKERDPEKFKHIILGGWLERAEGVIYENWEYGEFDESLPFGYGLDFGFFPDPDVCPKVAVDERRKTIYVKQVFKGNNLGTDELKVNLTKTTAYGKLIVADSAEKRLISDLKTRSGLNVLAVSKGAGSVLSGIKTMNNYKIVVSPESTDIGKELNNYVWSDKKSGVPVDLYNHWLDAIRYYVITVTKPQAKGLTRVN